MAKAIRQIETARNRLIFFRSQRLLSAVRKKSRNQLSHAWLTEFANGTIATPGIIRLEILNTAMDKMR